MGDAGVVVESKPGAEIPVNAPPSADPGEKSRTTRDTILSWRFNQDGTSLVISTQEGFRVFDITAQGELVMIFDIRTIPQVTHIQRLYSSNLVAFVSALDPEALKVFNMRRNDVICDHKYGAKIRWLSMNRSRVVVATEEKVFVHKIRNMDILHTISDVSCNPRDLFAMATYELRSYLAFPGEIDKGHLRVFDVDSCSEKYQLSAHHAPLQTFTFNEQATRLATSSTKGTVIRVFDASSGVKLHEFRRGVWQTTIYCLAFSASGEYLGCTSDHETVHVFKVLTDVQRKVMEESQGWVRSVGNLATLATGILSSEMERYIREERCVVSFPNPYHEVATKINVIANSTGEKLKIQISGINGFLNGFSLENVESTWNCELQKAYFLTENVRSKNKKT